MDTNNDGRDDLTGAPNRDRDRVGAVPPRKKSNLPMILGAIAALLVLFLLLRSCGDDDANDGAVLPADGVEATDGVAAGPADGTMMAGGEPMVYSDGAMGTYLAGQDAVPRTFTLDRITFASGSALLNAAARAEVTDVANALKARPSARVQLRAYADPEGDAAANQALSEQRAAAVRNALIEAGAGEGQVSVAAEGETGTAAIRANRKVELTVTAR